MITRRIKARLAGWLVRLAYKLHWDAARKQGDKAHRERKALQMEESAKRHKRRATRTARIVHSC
jgi:hypothetical protein